MAQCTKRATPFFKKKNPDVIVDTNSEKLTDKKFFLLDFISFFVINGLSTNDASRYFVWQWIFCPLKSASFSLVL